MIGGELREIGEPPVTDESKESVIGSVAEIKPVEQPQDEANIDHPEPLPPVPPAEKPLPQSSSVLRRPSTAAIESLNPDRSTLEIQEQVEGVIESGIAKDE